MSDHSIGVPLLIRDFTFIVLPANCSKPSDWFCIIVSKFLKNYLFDHGILSYTDLGVQRFILQNSKEVLIDFIQEVLGSLIEYEQSRKGELLSTLIVYFDHNKNIKKTADALHIHTNTLSYRLKRMEEILLTDLNDSQQLFNIHLAINIYQYIKDKDSLQKNQSYK